MSWNVVLSHQRVWNQLAGSRGRAAWAAGYKNPDGLHTVQSVLCCHVANVLRTLARGHRGFPFAMLRDGTSTDHASPKQPSHHQLRLDESHKAPPEC